MFIQPRRPRRGSRFRSGRLRTERERREYVISLYGTAVVKTALGIALLMAGLHAFRAAETHAAGVSVALRLFMPLAFAAGALFAIRAGVQSFREGREIMTTPLVRDDDDDGPAGTDTV
jgi:hypothetical protein